MTPWKSIFMSTAVATCFLLHMKQGFAQTTDGAFSLGFTIGAGAPLGEFNDRKDYMDTHSNGARTGVFRSMQATFRVKDFLRIPLELNWLNSPFHGQAVASGIYEDNPDSYVSVETDPWKSTAVLTGALFSFRLNPAADFPARLELKGMFGVNSVESYSYEVTTQRVSSVYPRSQESEKDTGFAYSYGLNFRHSITAEPADLPIDLIFSASYLSSRHKYRNVGLRYSDFTETELNYNVRVEALNISVGVLMLLN